MLSKWHGLKLNTSLDGRVIVTEHRALFDCPCHTPMKPALHLCFFNLPNDENYLGEVYRFYIFFCLYSEESNTWVWGGALESEF